MEAKNRSCSLSSACFSALQDGIGKLNFGKNEEDPRQRWKTEINLALEKICNTNKKWLWLIFIMTASPGILNGMHITSYVFFVDKNSPYCSIPALENAGWTPEQIRRVSLPNTDSLEDYGCKYYNWNYSSMATKSFTDVILHINSTEVKPELLTCADYKFEEYNSVISEWNLVCEKYYFRSNILAAYALGKFFGASFFGIIADKIGRKNSFTLAALCYLFSAMLTAFASSYSVFLVIRFLLGFGGVGCYSTAYTLLSEIIVGKSKTWVCCLYNASYAVGMIILSLIAYEVHYWKTLQILMSIPTIILPFYYWFIPESPQWLLSKNKSEEAWEIILKIDPTIGPPIDLPKLYYQVPKNTPTVKPSLYQKLVQPLAEFMSMFSSIKLTIRTIICFYIWFTVSAIYFGLAMNGNNFDIDPYVYIFLNGFLEIFSYALPVPLLNVCGRKTANLYLFTFTGIGLISILFLPKDLHLIILVVALLSRFCVTSAYVIFALYTSELFPTAIRNTAIGASITMSHVGTLVIPYIVDILGAYRWYIPSTIFGLLAVFCIFVLIPLPETRNKPLYNTVDEMNSPKNKNYVEK